MNASAKMKRNLRPAAANTKLVVILVILVVIAGIVWIVRATGESELDAAATAHLEKDFTFWCPECQKEFTMTGFEAREVPQREGEDGEILRECPKCKQFVLTKGGQPSAEPEQQGDVQVMQP
jgi:hypothetical protein